MLSSPYLEAAWDAHNSNLTGIEEKMVRTEKKVGSGEETKQKWEASTKLAVAVHPGLTLSIFFLVWRCCAGSDHKGEDCSHCAQRHKEHEKYTRNYSVCLLPLSNMHSLLSAVISTRWDDQEPEKTLRPSSYFFNYSASSTNSEQGCVRHEGLLTRPT